MENYYWTNDQSDIGTIDEDSHMHRCETEAQARAAATDDMKLSLDDSGQYEVISQPLDESDCWSKVPQDWTLERINEYAQEHRIDPADLIIRRPGHHPGAAT